MAASPESIPADVSMVYHGGCLDLISKLPDQSVDVVVASPPHWGQGQHPGGGTENHPRDYIAFLERVFVALHPKLKQYGIVWINMGDAYNTPINWAQEDYVDGSHGHERNEFAPDNAVHDLPRFRRRAFIDQEAGWLSYGKLLMLPQRLLVSLTNSAYLYRGEVVWAKTNPMPEGKCRRPHRQHETIYLLAKDEKHRFRTKPPVPSVWTFDDEGIEGLRHRSRLPVQLPLNCIEAYGRSGPEIVVLDPFSGSGSTGMAAARLGCTYIGFELEKAQVEESRARIARAAHRLGLPFVPVIETTKPEKVPCGSRKPR